MTFSSKEMAFDIVNWGEEMQAEEIIVLDIGQVSIITDYFVIMHARNRVLTVALADFISDSVEEKYSQHIPHKEGHPEGDWMLLDFGSVVVHIFLEETRRFYDLERLWIDAPKVKA